MIVARVLGICIVATLVHPLFVSAATIAELQAQIQDLMGQITALQSQDTSTNIAMPLASEVEIQTLALCPNIQRYLRRGMKGSDVTQLQKFLISHNLLAPDSASGFYGTLTEAAVKKFQCAQMNLCSGEPNANGYGAVGPKTRETVSKKCKTTGMEMPPLHSPSTTATALSTSTTPYAPQQSIKKTTFATGTATSLTKYPRFSNACVRKVIDYDKGENILSPAIPWCLWPSSPLVISVTHLSSMRTHWYVDANGSKIYDSNFIGDDALYMHDYVATDVGKIFRLDVTPLDATESSLEMTLDTLNYTDRLNITGRDYRNGYLFMGLNDLSVAGPVTGDVSIAFSFRVRGRELAEYAGKKSSHRVIMGTSLEWPEPGRSNTRHYLEFNLYKSPGFHTEHEANQCRKDGKTYDYCYYDSSAEGRLAERTHLPISAVPESGVPDKLEQSQWYTVNIPLSALIQSTNWRHPPSHWSQARFEGVYFGIESKGSSRMSIEIKDYEIVRR